MLQRRYGEAGIAVRRYMINYHTYIPYSRSISAAKINGEIMSSHPLTLYVSARARAARRIYTYLPFVKYMSLSRLPPSAVPVAPGARVRRESAVCGVV